RRSFGNHNSHITYASIPSHPANARVWARSQGFQFAQVTVHPSDASPLTADDVQISGVVIHSDVKRIGSVGFSHDTLTGLQRLILWSQRSNSLSIPTDCPQRDERLGWMADAHASSGEA